MNKTSIHNLYTEYRKIKKILEKSGEISVLTDYTNTMRKVLILSSASLFEVQMTDMLKNYVYSVSNQNKQLVSFIEKQALERKYHTLFDWDSNNVNRFLKLFGKDFETSINRKFQEEGKRKKNMIDFIELGHNRNLFAHEDFARYEYNSKNPEEIFKQYKSARKFIPFIKEQLLNVSTTEN
ncbi:HEPN domain-containing protein [Candidatus Ruminimicrobium bovinum]|uniref:HEPN domain-containing protein n=1 Tax=Candidatus Ruminimicrobium bovinum TaxID=3242779 RepID=UPI0039B8B1BC